MKIQGTNQKLPKILNQKLPRKTQLLLFYLKGKTIKRVLTFQSEKLRTVNLI